jgi:exopolysaccharide production protein ExoZ
MKKQNYVSIQILRGVAAVLVVAFHAGVMVADRFSGIGDHFVLRAGAAGVDIFFPISGFVMVVSTTAMQDRADAWRVFLRRRVIRIVPLYWLATTLKLVLLIVVPALALHSAMELPHVIGSYLFIFVPNPTGGTMPLVPVGWTLNFEMFFYAVFAAALFLRAPVVRTVGIVMVAVGEMALFRGPDWAAPLDVVNLIVLEFVAGMVLARVTLMGVRLAYVPALLLTIAALATLVASDTLPEAQVNSARLLYWGIPGAALVLAAVSLEPAADSPLLRVPKLLGDASYSIYLSHGFVLPVFGVVATRIGLGGPIGAALAFTGAIVLSAAVGIFVHLWIEQPIIRLRFWKRTTDPARMAEPKVVGLVRPVASADAIRPDAIAATRPSL